MPQTPAAGGLELPRRRLGDLPAALATAKQEGLGILATPTYAPWTNPLEKLWRKLKQEVLRLHRSSDDWPGLKRRIEEFLEQLLGGSSELLRYVGLGLPS